MRKQLLFLTACVLFSSCSSTKDYSLFSHLIQPSSKKPAPNLSLYPKYLVDKKLQEPVSLSWAGVLDNIYLKKDSEGRVVLKVKQHYLAVDSVALEKDKNDIRFQLSEKSDGVFECRIPFKKEPTLSQWQEYLDHLKAVGCTGHLIGYNSKKQPIIQAQILEGFEIKDFRNFEPEKDTKTGLIQLDEYGRPKYMTAAKQIIKLE